MRPDFERVELAKERLDGLKSTPGFKEKLKKAGNYELGYSYLLKEPKDRNDLVMAIRYFRAAALEKHGSAQEMLKELIPKILESAKYYLEEYFKNKKKDDAATARGLFKVVIEYGRKEESFSTQVGQAKKALLQLPSLTPKQPDNPIPLQPGTVSTMLAVTKGNSPVFTREADAPPSSSSSSSSNASSSLVTRETSAQPSSSSSSSSNVSSSSNLTKP